MIPEFITKNEGASEECIAKHENKWHIPLPKQYRDFMRKTDGSKVDKQWCFSLRNPLTKKIMLAQVSSLFPLSKIEEITLTWINQFEQVIRPVELVDYIDGNHNVIYRRQYCSLNQDSIGGILDHYLPIGNTNIGKLIIGCRFKDQGKIFLLFSHPADKEKLLRKVLIAKSFNDFLLSFKKGKKTNTLLESEVIYRRIKRRN